MATNNSTNNTIDEVVKDTSPQLGGDLDANSFDIGFDDNTGITDDSGKNQLVFRSTASAVNYIEVQNSATTTSPSLIPTGTDAGIGLNIIIKGTEANGAALNIKNSDSGQNGRVKIFEASANGNNSLTMSAATNLAADESVVWGNNCSVNINALNSVGYVQRTSSATMSSFAVNAALNASTSAVRGWTKQLFHNDSTALAQGPNTLVVTPFIGKGASSSLSSSITDRYFFNAGTYGTGTATGFAVSNDVLYALPIFLPPAFYDNFRIGIETADASSTADLNIGIYALDIQNQLAPAGGVSNTLIGARILDCGTISNISSTGEKTLSFTSTFLGGWNWVGIRADDIGTSLSLGVSPNLSSVSNIFYMNGAVASDGTTVGSETPAYGVYFNSQTSLPSTLASISISGFLTSPVGIALQAL